MSTRSKRSFKGFTLIELLVVIGIISVLVGIVIFAINPVVVIAKSRDSRARTEINQIKVALQLYYNDCHAYPLTIPWGQPMNRATLGAPVCAEGATYMNMVPNKTNYGFVGRKTAGGGCTTNGLDCDSYYLGARLNYAGTDDLSSVDKCTDGSAPSSVVVNNPVPIALTITNVAATVHANQGRDDTPNGGGLVVCPD